MTLDSIKSDEELKIDSQRKEHPRNHSINYKSEIDGISIIHEAYSRDGFALGAVIRQENGL